MRLHAANSSRAYLETDMRFHFGAEVFQDIHQGRSGSLTEAAIGHHRQIAAQFQQGIQIVERCLAFCDRRQDFKSPLRSDPAGVAFAATLNPEEIQQHFRQVHHTGIFIAD